MWISIRTMRTSISPRMLRNAEAFLRCALQYERRQIGSIVMTIGPAKRGHDETGFVCRIRVWSPYLGMFSVRDMGDTIRSAVQQASLRTRQVVRRRLHKRRSLAGRLDLSRLSFGLTMD